MTKVRNAAFILLCVVVFGTSQLSAGPPYCDEGDWHSSGAYLRDIWCDDLWWDGYWPDHSCQEAEEYQEFLDDACPLGVGYWDCWDDYNPPNTPELPTAQYVFRCIVN